MTDDVIAKAKECGAIDISYRYYPTHGKHFICNEATLRAFYKLSQADRDKELMGQEPLIFADVGHLREVSNGNNMMIYASSAQDEQKRLEPLFTHPSPEHVRDAERYRLLRQAGNDESIIAELEKSNADPEDPEQFDAAIDAVLAIRKQKGE